MGRFGGKNSPCLGVDLSTCLPIQLHGVGGRPEARAGCESEQQENADRRVRLIIVASAGS